MLGVSSGAVFRNRRGSIVAISIGNLHGRGRSPGSWVVCLTGTYTAVAVRDCATPRVSPGGRVIAVAGMRATVWSIGTRTGAVVAAVPGAVSVVRTAVIHHRSGAVPATVPTAIPPSATSTAHHRPHRDTDSKCKYGRRCHRRSDVCGNNIGIAVNHRRVIHGHIHHLWIRG